VTTLTDAKQYPREDIAELYRKRWLAELDIRAIKQTMGMDVLRCKSPAMVRKEIWTCLLAYNLIRTAMLQSAHEAGLSPRKLSFTAAMDAVAASLPLLSWGTGELAARLIAAQLAGMDAKLLPPPSGKLQKDCELRVKTLLDFLPKHDCFYIHLKGPDEPGPASGPAEILKQPY